MAARTAPARLRGAATGAAEGVQQFRVGSGTAVPYSFSKMLPEDAVSAEDWIRETENVVRELVQDLMLDRYGQSWVDHLGVTEERLARWSERQDEERKRRAGTVIDERILWYADFTDLWPILKKNWDLFKPCFGDLKRLEVYLDRLGALRNPGAHSRTLFPFERSLAEGMTGEFRQQVTLFRARGGGGPEPEHFPRIEFVRDSFGNQAESQHRVIPKQTGIVLRPGDEITFSGMGWDPGGEMLHWKVGVIGGPDLLDASGPDFECTWRVSESDIGENSFVTAEVTSGRSYHRLGDYDDKTIIAYRVLPRR